MFEADKELFITALRGTEVALRDELRELGFRGAKADRGGVRVPGGLNEAFDLCLHTRIGVRVLVPVGEFDAPTPEALYDGVFSIAWERVLDATRTVAVTCVSRESALHHTNFVSLKTKDAIVDRLRARDGERPSVHRDDPDVAVFVHLKNDRAKVFLDASGDSLHRRGYRLAHGEAPLKETLAAAVLRLSGWDRRSPFVDPTCGSGTLAIEADLWARNVAPGLARPRFGIERWARLDEGLVRYFGVARERARAAMSPSGPEVLGTDIHGAALEAAEANARRVGSRTRFLHRPLRALRATEPLGTVVANLPYGERLALDDAFWRELREGVERSRGMRFAFLLGAPPPDGLLPPPDALITLWNGPIECRLAVLEAF